MTSLPCVWLARHRRSWQTTVSLLPTSARADSDDRHSDVRPPTFK